jgi:hypothetical protein
VDDFSDLAKYSKLLALCNRVSNAPDKESLERALDDVTALLNEQQKTRDDPEKPTGVGVSPK